MNNATTIILIGILEALVVGAFSGCLTYCFSKRQPRP